MGRVYARSGGKMTSFVLPISEMVKNFNKEMDEKISTTILCKARKLNWFLSPLNTWVKRCYRLDSDETSSTWTSSQYIASCLLGGHSFSSVAKASVTLSAPRMENFEASSKSALVISSLLNWWLLMVWALKNTANIHCLFITRGSVFEILS